MYLIAALAALSDPTRLKIIKLLSKRNLSAGEIGRHFDITAPSLSHHLSTLLDARLVDHSRQGRQIIYSIQPKTVKMVIRELSNIINIKQ